MSMKCSEMSPSSKEEILIIGEMIRLNMHKDPSLIKDRRYHLRNYPCCFVGRDVIQWLIKRGEVLNTANAVACMRLLQENGIFHHVCDDHLFKNEYLFYRFRIDDGTFFVDTDYETYHQAIMIHQRIVGDSENCVMTDHTDENDILLENCFNASKLVTWMVQNDVVQDRYAAVTLCQQFLDVMVIKSVECDTLEFFDDNTLYHFIFDLENLLPLHKALNIGEDIDDGMKKLVVSPKQINLFTRLWKGNISDEVVETVPIKTIDYNESTDEHSIPSLKPVIIREVTVAELTNKESPYYWKNIRITSDSVGFGFVIRGNGPCYVQAIDPTGPASSAGLKVRMYIYSVNGKVVLNTPHRDVAKEIMKGVVVDLVVLQHFRTSN